MKIIATALPDATVNKPYKQKLVTGGKPPYHCTPKPDLRPAWPSPKLAK